MANTNFDEILSTTLYNQKSNIVDNIHNSNALLMLMKEKQRIETGGERVVVPVVYAKNATASSYAAYEELDVSRQDVITAAEFNWKNYSAQVSISGPERRKNSGKQALINMLEAKIKNAEFSLMEDLTTGLFADGSDSDDIVGLGAAVLASGTYGNINGTTYSYWRSTIDSTPETLSLADMRTAYNSASIGGADAPDLVATTQTLYEKYESLLQANQRFNTDPKSRGGKMLADGGFELLEFKGAPMVFDELCTAGEMYFLNTNHLRFHVHKDANFTPGEFIRPNNQDVMTASILWMGALVSDRRKSLSALRNKTT